MRHSTEACHPHMQERLRGLFPGLATPMEGNNTPTYMQWGLACVRSRAFQLGKERFAMVPFLDIANHAPEANAAFRNSKSDAAVELVAVSDIVAGQEAVISYTECQGYGAVHGLMSEFLLASECIAMSSCAGSLEEALSAAHA